MSRWDALKPSAPVQHQAHRQQRVLVGGSAAGRRQRNTGQQNSSSRGFGNKLQHHPSNGTSGGVCSSSELEERRRIKSNNFNNDHRNRNEQQQQEEETAPAATLARYHLLRQQLFGTMKAKTTDPNLQDVSNRGNDDGSSNIALAQLADLVSSTLDDLPLPVEQVVRETICGAFLPHLEGARLSDASTATIATFSSPPSASKSRRAVLRALTRTLQDGRYASVMMAPIVDDVDADTGEERQRSNPVRLRLFRALQDNLLEEAGVTGTAGGLNESSTSNNDDNEAMRTLIPACHALTAALRAAHQLDGTKRHAQNSDADVDVSTVKSFITQRMAANSEAGDDFGCALALLFALLRRHPETAAAFILPLLEKPTGWNGFSCNMCGFQGSVFLNLLHLPKMSTAIEDASLSNRQLTIDCIIELIRHAPLDLWLKRHHQQKGSTGRSIIFSTLSYPDRIIEGLDDVLKSTACVLQREETSGSMTLLAKTLLLKIPYQQANLLQASGLQLISVLAKQVRVVSRNNSMGASSVLVDAAGGQMTPQGHLTAMSFPLHSWLGSSEGRHFVKKILLGLKTSCDQHHSLLIKERALLMRSFFRSYPKLVTEDLEVQQAFWCSLEELTAPGNDSSAHLAGLELLVGLLQGRTDHNNAARGKEGKVVCSFALSRIWPILLRMVQTGTFSCKQAASAAYGCFLPGDWDELSGSTGECLSHLDGLLDLCTQKNTSLQVQSYKTLGDICSHLFSSQRKCFLSPFNQAREELIIICDKVWHLLLAKACSIPQARVKSMALFAIGNLVLALKEVLPFVSEMLDVGFLANLAIRVRRCMDDSDEKVVGNAIRSIGHVVVLWELSGAVALSHSASSRCRINGVEEMKTLQDNTAFLLDLLSLLTQKVHCAMGLLWPSSDYKQHAALLNWKQRQAAKKHGWGACHTLARLMEAGVAQKNELHHGVGNFLVALLWCVNKGVKDGCSSSSCEKVVCAASAAVRGVESSKISSLLPASCEHSYLKAQCIVSSAVFLVLRPAKPSSSNKLAQEIDLLLQHLLQTISVEDATFIIIHQHLDDSPVGGGNGSDGGPLLALFNWMVERECPVHAFGAFALAMQREDIIVTTKTVDIELLFSSAAAVTCDGGDDHKHRYHHDPDDDDEL